MVRRDLIIRNRLGLHARAAARFVHLASRFRSRVTLERDGQAVDGKSILGLLLLAATQGSALKLAVAGEDEEQAAAALAALVATGFDEGVSA